MKKVLSAIVVLFAGIASAQPAPGTDASRQPGAESSRQSVTVSAADLQSKGDYYAKLAAYYRGLAVPASKQMIAYFTLANRAEQRAEHYRMATSEAQHRG